MKTLTLYDRINYQTELFPLNFDSPKSIKNNVSNNLTFSQMNFDIFKIQTKILSTMANILIVIISCTNSN